MSAGSTRRLSRPDLAANMAEFCRLAMVPWILRISTGMAYLELAPPLRWSRSPPNQDQGQAQLASRHIVKKLAGQGRFSQPDGSISPRNVQ